MHYSLDVGICDLLRVELDAGESIVAEVGKLIFARGGIVWDVAFPGAGFGGKIAAAFRRRMSGGAVVMTTYAGPGTVGFAGDRPGSIRAVDLADGEEIIVRRGSFLAALGSVDLSVALVSRLRAGVLAGHTLLLQRVTGPGLVWLFAAGDFVAFDLAAGEVLRADTSSGVCFDATVDFSAAWVGGVGRAVLGGEGFFMSTYGGPGRVTLQTLGHAPPGVGPKEKR